MDFSAHTFPRRPLTAKNGARLALENLVYLLRYWEHLTEECCLPNASAFNGQYIELSLGICAHTDMHDFYMDKTNPVFVDMVKLFPEFSGQVSFPVAGCTEYTTFYDFRTPKRKRYVKHCIDYLKAFIQS